MSIGGVLTDMDGVHYKYAKDVRINLYKIKLMFPGHGRIYFLDIQNQHKIVIYQIIK